MLEQIASWPNLIEAYDAVRLTKRMSVPAAGYHADYAAGLAEIRETLLNGTWRLAPCEKFYVYNYTKRREVEAPAYPDRIVHHAIVQVIEPLFEKRFIFDSYSCRKGKGNHAAVDRAEAFLRRSAPCYILQCDISKFFPSIHHETLMEIVSRTISEPETLALIRHAAFSNDTGRGVPIGALTSQLLSNVYMDVFDHYMKDDLGIKHYIRYADDFVIFERDKVRLRELFAVAETFLSEKLKLTLNPKSGIFASSQGLDFCGYRIWTTHRKPRKRVVKGFKIKIRDARHSGDDEYVAQLVNSFTAYMRHCDGWKTTISTIVDRGGFKL